MQVSKELKKMGIVDGGVVDDMTPLEREIYNYNTAEGDLKDGIDCPDCLNKGHIAFDYNGYLSTKPCHCLNKRNVKRMLERSGLAKLAERYTFENFDVSTQIGKAILRRAKKYLEEDYKNKWFFIGGQSGVGKTHISTAVTFELMNREIPTLYALWRDLVSECKAQFNGGDVDEVLEKYQQIRLLYIDDFLKGERPTPTELDFAYKIINYRYNNNLVTIISSESTLAQIIELDEAIGSRIVEMAKEHIINIDKDKEKNHRM